MKTLLKFLAVLVAGAIGGILAAQITAPYFAEKPLFGKKQETPTQVIQKEEVRIQENTALTQAIEKVEKSVVGIGSKSGVKNLFNGSGLIITNDGLILTLSNTVSQNAVVFYEGETLPAKILKRDTQNNLALLKIEKGNLSVCSFADQTKIKMGDRVFLLGEKFSVDKFIKFTNEGIIKNFDANLIETNISEGKFAPGTTLFNIDGEVVGLNYLSSDGKILSVPVQKIKTFTGF